MNLPEFLTKDSDGSIRIRDHRIGLEHLIHDYNEGYSAEALAEEYPAVSLSLVHKVIAFYLDNRVEVDRYVAECWTECDRHRNAASQGPTLEELRRRQRELRTAGTS
jgi:uncharacterized protein (DUF433 family)